MISEKSKQSVQWILDNSDTFERLFSPNKPNTKDTLKIVNAAEAIREYQTLCEKLSEAIKIYGTHSPSCSRGKYGNDEDCTCGLDQYK